MGKTDATGDGPDRRTLLRSIAAAPVAVGLAGCTVDTGDGGFSVRIGGDDDDEGDAGPETPDDGDEQTPAEGTRPESPPALDEDCIEYGTDVMEALTVEETNGVWTVTDGTMSLLSFDDRDDAERAVDVIQSYGFTWQCFLVRPDPGMMYWLAEGRSVATGDAQVGDEDCISFDRTNLETEQRGDSTAVVDDSMSLLTFEESLAAETAIDVIQHYEFDAVCYVGRPDPGLEYFLSESQ